MRRRASTGADSQASVAAMGPREKRPWYSDLRDPAALADLLLDPRIDVRLIRGTYLEKLHQAKQTVIRRQEIETEADAVVTPEELLRWKTDEGFRRRVRIIGVSHVWETMEHPDPTGHQLGMLVNARLWPDKWSWYFFDYMSIYQFYRGYQYSRQQRCFDAAMLHMHFFYAHEHTYTYCIESLTPPDQIDGDRKIEVFFTPDGRGESGQVQEVQIQALNANTTPYSHRGWCEAEMQWSSMRDRLQTHSLGSRCLHPWNRAPMPPNVFQEKVLQKDLKFTHRNNSDQVVQLQARVFMDKALNCTSLSLTRLPRDQVVVLGRALCFYKKLQTLSVTNSILDKEGCEELGKNLRVKMLNLTRNTMLDGSLAALSAGLVDNRSVLHANLSCLLLGDAHVKAIADVLRSQSSQLQTLDLSKNEIEDDGAAALAEVLPANQCLRNLILCSNRISTVGATAFARAIQTGEVTLQMLDLDQNEFAELGKSALVVAADEAWRKGVRRFVVTFRPHGKKELKPKLQTLRIWMMRVAVTTQTLCYLLHVLRVLTWWREFLAFAKYVEYLQKDPEVSSSYSSEQLDAARARAWSGAWLLLPAAVLLLVILCYVGGLALDFIFAALLWHQGFWFRGLSLGLKKPWRTLRKFGFVGCRAFLVVLTLMLACFRSWSFTARLTMYITVADVALQGASRAHDLGALILRVIHLTSRQCKALSDVAEPFTV
ncbi:Nlrc3 [Symbiodinium necroappetens]|uniref:Nlrc3 protein n=1 Tax=Symbiodinium necroappetens TaxID=1628268 RepID=A0A812PRJ8_9DINO|nr:Nlrc3 [Symbiodinium necroappetens]